MTSSRTGQLVSDDYAGYKKSFKDEGVTELGCMVHARRKFVELHIAGKSQIVGEAVQQIRELYEVEQKAHPLSVEERHRIRQQVPDGTAIAKALDYSLNRWTALIRYLEDGAIPIDNNWVENLIRPWRWAVKTGC